MLIHRSTTLGKTGSGTVCLHFPNQPAVLAGGSVVVAGMRVSQFLSVLLLGTALTLTLCFGVAAWRQSAVRDVDITVTIPHKENGWRARPTN
ncbi:putative membrane protein [Bradyrhizobium sp. LM6.10]